MIISNFPLLFLEKITEGRQPIEIQIRELQHGTTTKAEYYIFAVIVGFHQAIQQYISDNFVFLHLKHLWPIDE